MATNGAGLRRYVIVRNIDNIGASSAEDLAGACRKSNATIAELRHNVQWVHSYVVKDKTYCIYLAPGEDAIKAHAAASGFPADSVEEVQAIIDPVVGYSSLVAK